MYLSMKINGNVFISPSEGVKFGYINKIKNKKIDWSLITNMKIKDIVNMKNIEFKKFRIR